jgi:hypothetical protein
MIELIQITNDPAFAHRCDQLEGLRLFVDLERLGKAERQAGRDTFISSHTVADVRAVRSQVRRRPLMVRVNPLHPGTRGEVEAVLAEGAEQLMLPMFSQARELREFAALVGGRAPIVALLETAAAVDCLPEWIVTPGLHEVFVGLNDLHLSLGHRFMFEPLAQGWVEQIARAVKGQGLKFGFGGIARMDEGLLPGRDVLAEHLRLGSGSVILSRTFHRESEGSVFEAEVAALRQAEAELGMRTPEQIAADAQRIRAAIAGIAAGQPRLA